MLDIGLSKRKMEVDAARKCVKAVFTLKNAYISETKHDHIKLHNFKGKLVKLSSHKDFKITLKGMPF